MGKGIIFITQFCPFDLRIMARMLLLAGSGSELTRSSFENPVPDDPALELEYPAPELE